MFAPRLTPEERYWIKWALVGGMITAATSAVCDLAKTELAGWIARRRAQKAKNQTEGGA